MPLEIKELHIKVTVNQPQGAAGSGDVFAGNSAEKKDDKEGLVQQCIEQVFDLINSKNER